MSIDRNLIGRLEFIRDYECKVDAEVNAINEAIAELSKHTEERTETHACDLIARHDAIDTVRHLQTYKLAEGDDMLLVDLADVQTELMMMPPAEPERKTGHWIEHYGDSKCSECGYELKIYDTNYCPNCGARMEGENDG